MAKLRAADGSKLEAKLQKELIAYLTLRGWKVRVFIGSVFQTGVPDLWIYHPLYGFRWVDLKRPGQYSFTKAQRAKWPLWDADGIGIWILTGAGHDEYAKLFGPPNWSDYWKPQWGNVRELIDELKEEHARSNS